MVICGFAYISFELDPLGHIIKWVASAVSDNTFIYVVRYLVAMETLQYIFMSARTVVLVAIFGAILRCEMVDRLKNLPMSMEQLQQYRQLQLVSLLTVPFEELGSAQVLLSEGSIVVIGVPFVFICFRFGYSNMALVSIPSVFASFIVIQVIFSVCTAVYTKSLSLIRSWTMQANRSNGYKKLYYTKCLKGVEPICIPVLNTGVFDSEIRINYTEKLRAYCIDITIAISSIAN